MWRRLIQILGLLLCLVGWGFVGCTLAMDYWRVAQLGGQGGSSVVVTAWYWSDLWRDCYEDSTALVNCVDFGVLWRVKPYVQAVRGLLIIGLSLGFVATVLAFFGLECTHLGGDRRNKDNTLRRACAVHVLGCVSDMAAYCLYINRVVSAFLHSKVDPTKLRYEIGPALCLGLVGSSLIFLGCTVYCATVCRNYHPKRRPAFICTEGKENQVLRWQKHICGLSKMSNERKVFAYETSSVVTV